MGQRYFVADDRNLELISTPGHSNLPDNQSLLVRNVPNMGTVAIVGDLFRNQNDVRTRVDNSVSDDASCRHTYIRTMY